MHNRETSWQPSLREAGILRKFDQDLHAFWQTKCPGMMMICRGGYITRIQQIAVSSMLTEISSRLSELRQQYRSTQAGSLSFAGS